MRNLFERIRHRWRARRRGLSEDRVVCYNRPRRQKQTCTLNTLMHTLVIIHLIACFLMIGAILLQSGKGAEIGAAFGGSSQTVFGSRGPANFLSKFTVVVAVVFMVTSLSLAILAKERTFSSTVIDLKKKETPPQRPRRSHGQTGSRLAFLLIPPPPTSQTIFTILRTLKKGCQQGRSDREPEAYGLIKTLRV